MKRYYINKDYCDTNLLISQALRTQSFPTSYVIDKQYRIVGEVNGLKDFSEQLNSITKKVPKSTTNNMLDYSLKALLDYFEDDFDNMYANAVDSRKYGDYFFNNYLIYLYWNRKGINDSVAYYKNAALNTLEGADMFIYESLIREIDPENKLLELIEHYSSNHVHDENCGHQH